MSSLRELRAKKARPWPWFVAATTDSNLTTTALLCAIVLLTTVYTILRFPDLGAIIAQYNQF